jgi:hypothetical protein
MPGGRPAIYKTEYAEIARDCCAAGATNETLAERFAVSRRTVDRWIADIADFRDAVSDGREIANGKVVSALFARATGMEQKMVKVFCHNGRPITVDYTVEVLPDVRACMFWLRNRLPEQWRENRPLSNDRNELDFRDLEEACERVRRANVGDGAASSARSNADALAASFAERLDVHR